MNQIQFFPERKKFDDRRHYMACFFEDINRAGDGGLYGEMLLNRAFDNGVLPKDCTYDTATRTITSETMLREGAG